MTNEEIIELAKHQKWLGNADGWTFNSRQQLITFARAVQEKTREECAEKFEEMQSNGDAWVSTVAASAAIRSQSDE